MAKLSTHITIPKLNFYFALLVAFVIPIYRLATSYAIIFWLITWLIERIKKYPTQKISTQQKIPLFAILLFYFLHIIGLLFTENIHNGFVDLRIKLPLLLFPVIFLFTNKLYSRFFHLILASFLFGIIGMSFFLLIRATYFFPVEHSAAFFYTHFSYYFHPSYFSMYVTFAVVIVLFLYEKFGYNKKHLLFTILISLFLFIINFLLASKTGIFTFLLIISTYGVLKLFRKHKLMLATALGIVFLLLYAEIRHNPRMFDLFHINIANIKKSTKASNEVRLLILNSTLKVIKQNPFGYGPGDSKNILVAKYKKEGITGALKEKLNAHNQYLETTIGLGVFGVILLLFILIYSLGIAVKKHNFLLYLFLLLVGINFISESMLNRQNGIVFFTFFIALLITASQSKNNFISKVD